MSSKQRGLSLVELVIAMLIIGVGLAGVLAAFSTTVRGSAETLVQRKLLLLAEGLLEEALSRPHALQPGGASAGCSRQAFNDVRDYDGYDAEICRVDGTPISGMAGYRQAVSVSAVSLGGSPALRIVVSARVGGERVELVGWRTAYAP